MSGEDWNKVFASEIKESGVPDIWSLYVDEDLQKQHGKVYCIQNTYGSFRCSNCKRSWSSLKVCILFHTNLNKSKKRGIVAMRIFGQKCQLCNYSAMQKPKVPQENITRVHSNVVNHIQRVFYGKKNSKKDQRAINYGKQDGPHDEEHCEACQNNLCERGWQMEPNLCEQQMESQESSSSNLLSTLVVGIGGLALLYLSSK